VTAATVTTPAAGLAAARQPASPPGRRPSRSPGAAWPATSQDRDAVWERLAGPPFAPASAKAGGEHQLGLLLDWLAAGTPVSLSNALTGIDHRNVGLVIKAIVLATGAGLPGNGTTTAALHALAQQR
jgi:hypothetical protein